MVEERSLKLLLTFPHLGWEVGSKQMELHPGGGSLRGSSIVVATLMFVGVAGVTAARRNGLLSMKDLTDLVMESIF